MHHQVEQTSLQNIKYYNHHEVRIECIAEVLHYIYLCYDETFIVILLLSYCFIRVKVTISNISVLFSLVVAMAMIYMCVLGPNFQQCVTSIIW